MNTRRQHCIRGPLLWPFFALLLCLGAEALGAQAGGAAPAGSPPSPGKTAPAIAPAGAQAAPGQGGTAAPGGAATLPPGYGALKLGMSRDEAIAELKADPLFAWRGPEDVSLLPSPNQSLIEVSGLSFVRRAFLQFDADRLWVIILELAEDRVDHYSVWTSLVAKYGEPTSLDPSASVWEDGKIRMSLERPLTLRYMDLAEFRKLQAAAGAKVSVEELDRRSFLGGL